jgi:hypothetical protein
MRVKLCAQSTYFTVRGQSYFSRLPKYWPPTPSPPGECVLPLPPPTKAGVTHSPGGEGDGGSILWKTREIELPSYSKKMHSVAVRMDPPQLSFDRLTPTKTSHQKSILKVQKSVDRLLFILYLEFFNFIHIFEFYVVTLSIIFFKWIINN